MSENIRQQGQKEISEACVPLLLPDMPGGTRSRRSSVMHLANGQPKIWAPLAKMECRIWRGETGTFQHVLVGTS